MSGAVSNSSDLVEQLVKTETQLMLMFQSGKPMPKVGCRPALLSASVAPTRPPNPWKITPGAC
jgi:hypothetical protein